MSQVAALSAVIEGVNELAMLRNVAEYSPPRRGGVDAPLIKWIRSEMGAAGVVSSAKPFRRKHFAELTTSPPLARASAGARQYRRDAGLTTPSAPLPWLCGIFVGGAATPPLRGGEYPELKFSPIHSHLHRAPLQFGNNGTNRWTS